MNIDALCVPLDEAKSWLDRFTRREYEKGFRAFCERFGPAYDQAVAEAGEDLTALADAILDAVEERWRHQHFWNRSAVRGNHKQVLVSFLSPMLLDREGTGCPDLARVLCERWGERWPKDAEGQMEQAERLALQSELDSMADITISMLESFGIPAFKVGTQGKVLLGFAGLGVDIYVPASRLEEAQSLLTAQSGSEE